MSAIGRNHGFTLIELLTVLAILVLATSLIPIAYNRMLTSRQLLGARDHIVLLLRRAESLSAASGQPVRLALTDSGAVALSLANAGTVIETWPVPSGIQMSVSGDDEHGRHSITDYPDGSAEAGAFVIRSGHHEVNVSISAITGHLSTSDVR